MFSRRAYVAIKAETTENTPVLPDQYIGVTALDIVTQYKYIPSTPILADRNTRVNPVKGPIDPPQGSLTLQIEPKKFPNFMKAVFGALTSGVYFPIYQRLFTGAVTGTPAVGATLSQAVTLATATVNALVSATSFDLRDITIGFDATNLVTGTNPDGTTFTMTPSATLTSGTFTVGETITGATSAKTAVVLAVSKELDYLLVGTLSGTFTALETISGGSSLKKATLGTYASTVYGHEAKAPQNSLQTYTVDVGYENEVIRYMGVRFPAINSLAPKDNIMTAEVGVFARSAFVVGRVLAAVSAGSSKVVTLDQTQGLTTSDTVKVWRPSTGVFKDLASVGVKTTTITAVSAGTSVTLGTVTDPLVAGDLLVIAPATASYTVGKELPWIGGTVARIGSTLNETIAASAASIEEFEAMVVNEMEGRHAANEASMGGRFPTANHLKGLHVEGSLKQAYANPTFIDRMRNGTETCLHVVTLGAVIGATTLYNTIDLRIGRLVFEPFNPAIEEDALLDLNMSFQAYKDDTSGFTAKMLAINDVASYT